MLGLLVGCALVHIVTSCTWTDESCEFWLEVKHQLTMMHERQAVYAHKGQLYHYDVTNTSGTEPVNPEQVVVADGWETQRLVATINGAMPGPPIVVYEGQNVIVHVKNMMTSASLTIHWHGLHQNGTPWMDGVAFITQCPILPYSSFKYEFQASPRGTFWYHSHIGTQLSLGVLGAFIVRERKAPIMDEHIVMLMDWNHQIDAELMHMRMEYGNYENRSMMQSSESLEGGKFSMFQFHSGLINGRGRFYYEDGSHTQSPLTVYEVEQGKSYRFRIIGSGSLYPFRVSIDNHTLTVLASDGYDVQPLDVESLIINPGERYDVQIEARENVSNYWVRAQTLEINVKNHIAEAILRYKGAAEEEPTTLKKDCSEEDRCMVVNCPFAYYPEDENTDCIMLGELRSLHDHTTPGYPDHGEDIEDIFLNFAFPGTTYTPGSTNGRAFRKPPVSALTQPTEIPNTCGEECGEDKVCLCAYSIDLQDNKIYQLVILNMGIGKGWAHPIHMHGHSFHVVKMGYPSYNSSSGLVLDDNVDIDCGGHPDKDKSFCNSATWANRSWGGNNVPGLELNSPPRKDTIIIPTGGYAVVRIRADNPGVWFMHCHIELHNLDGMAVMLNESFPQHPAPPRGFQICGDFEAGKVHQGFYEDNNDNCCSETLFWAVVASLTAVIAMLVVVIVCLLRRRTDDRGMSDRSPAGAYHNKGFTAKETVNS